MTSPVDFCNQAINRLGGVPLISFEDNTAEADLCARLYDPAKRSMLRSYAWNCAIKRAKLAKRAEDPPNEWNHSFALPEDCLRVLAVYIGDDKATRQKSYTDAAYTVEGQSVYTWEENVYLKYVANILEEEMDAHLEEALVAKMAHVLAYPVTGSNTTTSQLKEEAMMALEEARTTDSQENPHDRFRVDRLRIVRR